MTQTTGDTAAYGWSEERRSFSFVIPPVLSLLRQFVGGPEGCRILDLGCGKGDLCGALRRTGYDVAGAEVDSKGCALARERYRDVPFFQVGVYDDPRSVLEGGLYDCVVSTEVIEHLYAPQKLPVFASQVLRPEGWLIVSAPYHGYLKNLVWSVFNYWDVHPAEQYMF